jgi:hypothetical protein
LHHTSTCAAKTHTLSFQDTERPQTIRSSRRRLRSSSGFANPFSTGHHQHQESIHLGDRGRGSSGRAALVVAIIGGSNHDHDAMFAASEIFTGGCKRRAVALQNASGVAAERVSLHAATRFDDDTKNDAISNMIITDVPHKDDASCTCFSSAFKSAVALPSSSSKRVQGGGGGITEDGSACSCPTASTTRRRNARAAIE